MPNHHTCLSPWRHRLLIAGSVCAWFVLWPRAGILLGYLSGSPALGLLSIGLGLTVGTVWVKALADWRCQPPQQTQRGLSPLAHLTIAALLMGRRDV